MANGVLVLGYFGYNNNQLDGQTIKTRNLFKLVNKKLPGQVNYFDTQDIKYNKLAAFRLFLSLLKAKKLIYLPAHNNLRIVFPVIYFLAVIRGIDILYFVVGGWLPEYLEEKKFHQKFLSRIKGIFTETALMKTQLESKYSFKNVDVFSNFRVFDFLKTESLEERKCFKLVFMSRINKMKGLDDIFALAHYFTKHQLGDRVIIDFYGPIFPADKDTFFQQMTEFPFVSYKGELEPNDIHQTIAAYDVLLLPTRYYTEGLPGAIIDAYVAGIPVIVSAWKHAHEFVKEGLTGLIFKWEDTDEFIQKVTELYNNPELLAKMKRNAYQERELYSSDTAWQHLKNILEV